MNNKMSSQETPMFWKVEPLSPSGTPPPFDDDEWLFLEEKPAVLDGIDANESVLYEEQLTRAQVASKILEELELKTWIKEEESFADWLEEKIDLPIFEELPAPECGQNRAVTASTPYPSKAQSIHVNAAPMVIAVNGDTTQSLLREFETVLGDVEACHQIASTTTLTPPQSPPPTILCKQQIIGSHHRQQQQAHLLLSLQPIHQVQQQQQQAFVYEQQQQPHLQLHQFSEENAAITSLHGQPQPIGNTSYSLPLSSNANSEPLSQQPQQQGVAEQWNAENLSLDPLVHSGDVAQELAQVDEYVRSCAEDVAASPSSSSFSCTSEDSSDPDWSFESSPSTSSSPRKATSNSSRSGRRSSKPYSRPNVEDKRVRKKEQNKNAATRYRQKKKQEIKEIVGEEQELQNKNESLQAKLKDLQREIGYLKGLMRDLFKAKGLLN